MSEMVQPEERKQRLGELLDANATLYTEIDAANPTLGAFALAAREALAQPKFQDLLGRVYRLHPLRDEKFDAKLLERVFMADLRAYDPSFPYDYRKPEVWLQRFSELELRSRMKRWRAFRANINRPVQSNIADRYKTVKLLAALLGPERWENPSHLDIGSSVLHGDLKLAYEQDGRYGFSFSPIEIAYDREREQTDYRATELANVALAATVNFGVMTGIDITNIDDPAVRRWARDCSFYPDELLDNEKVGEYERLDRLDPLHKRVGFLQGDFAQMDPRDILRLTPTDGYDIITFSTVFYQVSREDQLKMRINAYNLLSPNGIIIIQDARDGDFSKPYNYMTRVIDALAPSNPETPVIEWKSGRCKKAVAGMGKLSVSGTMLTLPDALEAQFGEAI